MILGAPAKPDLTTGFNLQREGRCALAARTGHGEVHAGFRVAAFGWIPSILHDPAGHDVRFYTVRHHREPHRDDVLLADGPGEIARRRAAELGAR